MDATLPQMPSFNFDRLDPFALEQTLAYFRENPGQPVWEDYDNIGRGMYTNMLERDDGMDDWVMADGVQGVQAGLQDAAETARPLIPNTPIIMREVSIAGLQCTWEGCDIVSDSTGILSSHLESHALGACERWTRHSGCVWQGCQSKATFETAGAYKKHLKNIHTQPIICTKTKCSYRKPFRNEADLERHQATIHLGVEKFWCPYANCPSETQTFKRKDKLLLHIRETVHENDDYCPFQHCEAKQRDTATPFTTRRGISSHFTKIHEPNPEQGLRCALGSCGSNATRDVWYQTGLHDHLETCHGIEFHLAWVILENLRDSGSKVLLVDHFTHPDPDQSNRSYTGPWHDCTVCAQAPTENRTSFNGQIDGGKCTV
ncbi:hypothetical protein BKA64DRAFT_714836 [Cadophora sp. MPI-SDFR-AT-0126]|nr:hypothetical protein BKA64DRAFT_714836 [Leotiomycetes sp. MPI-SDFR-AT-0126]